MAKIIFSIACNHVIKVPKCTCDNIVVNFQQNSYLSVSEQYEPYIAHSLTDNYYDIVLATCVNFLLT